jgi:hypothetical protein
MTDVGFLSAATVVAILAGVALLSMLGALMLAPPDRLGRRHVVAFLGYLAGSWALEDLVLALIRHTL